VSDFVNNFSMILVVVVLLWTVCGGHASLCAVNRASPAATGSPHVAKDVEPWLADVVTPRLIEVIEVVDLPIGIVEVVDFSETVASPISHVSSTLVAVPEDTEDDQDLLALMDRITDTVDHICIHEDYQDALAWMDQIADAVHHVCAFELTTPYSTAEEPQEVLHLNEEQKLALAVRNEIRAQVDIFQGLPVSHAPINIEGTLAYLVEQHGNPTFNDGDVYAAQEQQWYKNCKIEGGEIFYDMNASVISHCPVELCSLGRSVFGDARDMSFMLNDLKDELPAEFIEDFEQSRFELRYRARDRVTNINFWHVRCCEQWYIIKAANTPRPVECWDDVLKAHWERVRRSTSAYPDIERGLEGLCSHSRSYLNDAEEYVINIGTVEYNQYEIEYEDSSQMQKNLQARPEDTQSPNRNHVLNWLTPASRAKRVRHLRVRHQGRYRTPCISRRSRTWPHTCQLLPAGIPRHIRSAASDVCATGFEGQGQRNHGR